MNLTMWRKALEVIPEVSRQEWDRLDLLSRWLIASRAAVLVMTFTSAALAGLFAVRDQTFEPVSWLVLTVGLILAHAANNLLNDHIDYALGIDHHNYFRTLYGTQPVAQGLMRRGEHLAYFTITALMALAAGIYLLAVNGWDWRIWILLGAGALFLLFYTWPLKYIGLGEVAVLVVWGPLMIGGGYYVLARNWNWNVVLAALPYVLGVTSVILGKHVDKITQDRARKVFTFPVLVGERAGRYAALALMLLSYAFTGYLIAVGYFSPVLLIVLLGLPRLAKVAPAFIAARPAAPPQDFPVGQGGWPLYFAPLAFWNVRRFGMLYLTGVVLDVILRRLA